MANTSQIKSRERVAAHGEVFTAEREVKAMLDMLPRKIFENSDTKFLDQCSKSGVFLREITKRLMAGM